MIHFSTEVTGAKTDKRQFPLESLVPKLETPMTTAVLSDLLLGTTKGPPESPSQIPFPSSLDPAQRYNLVFLKHSALPGGSIGNPTYLNLSGYGPLPTMIYTVKNGIFLPKLF